MKKWLFAIVGFLILIVFLDYFLIAPKIEGSSRIQSSLIIKAWHLFHKKDLRWDIYTVPIKENLYPIEKKESLVLVSEDPETEKYMFIRKSVKRQEFLSVASKQPFSGYEVVSEASHAETSLSATVMFQSIQKKDSLLVVIYFPRIDFHAFLWGNSKNLLDMVRYSESIVQRNLLPINGESVDSVSTLLSVYEDSRSTAHSPR